MYLASIEDEDGDLIWSKTHQPFYSTGSLQSFPIVQDDDGFIGASYYFDGSFDVRPLIMQFTPTGEIEWTRQITIDPDADVYLKDMEPTPDGGYVLAGYQYSPAPQKSWVLKIDAFFVSGFFPTIHLL